MASVTVASRERRRDRLRRRDAGRRLGDVQREITRFAVDAGLTLIANAEETLDLETVFLRLIDQKEVAA